MTDSIWDGIERRKLNRRSNECPYTSCREPEIAAEHAAERAVHRVFAIMGVNVDKPEQIEEFRAGLRFGREMQRLANRGLVAFVIVICSGAAAALWLGIKELAGKP